MESSPYNKNNFLINSDQLNIIFKNNGLEFIKINNINLYQKSFIHESYRKLKCYDKMSNENSNLELQEESYERLEFIGDALIESIVANYLYDRYHETYKQDEGFLTKLKTRIVCGKNLTYLSSCINFQEYIVISKSIEDKCNGRQNMKDHKILCDVFEAFCGALYKDTDDYNIVKRFMIYVIENYLDLSEFIINDINYKDQLWRYIKKTYNKYPRIVTEETDDIYKTIIYNGDDKIGYSEDDNKKDSQQQASKEGLKFYGVLN